MISSHTGFQPLKEVWLGDCYPSSWYEYGFDSKARDILQKITEMTKEDLSKFQKLLETLGIVVRRPYLPFKDNFLDWQGNLVKPPIAPRDWALTLDDTLYILPQYENRQTGFEDTLVLYSQQGQKFCVLDRAKPDDLCYVAFPSTVRVGRDIYLDFFAMGGKDARGYDHFMKAATELSKNYRVHITYTGDHADGVFCPISPGNIFTTHYRSDYTKTFPGWKVFHLIDSTKNRIDLGFNGLEHSTTSRWWVPGVSLQIYNDSILKYAETWIGDWRESVFEVNMLVVDEKNICCIAENDWACGELEKMGFNVHVIDFRCRGFWDAGLHCLTVDIHRTGERQDYWPDRGPNGIYEYEV